MQHRLRLALAVSLMLVVPASAFAGGKHAAKHAAKHGNKKVAPKPPTKAPADESAAMHKTLKRMIGAIRYNRKAKALAQFDGVAQAKFLCGTYWAKATPAQRSEFVTLFHAMFAGIAFPNIRKNFKNLETVLYSKAKGHGTAAKVNAVIVILHPLKKQEIQASFHMLKTAGLWKVVDVQVKGNPSMLTRIRDDQVQKILAKGGFAKLIILLQKRVAKLK